MSDHSKREDTMKEGRDGWSVYIMLSSCFLIDFRDFFPTIRMFSYS